MIYSWYVHLWNITYIHNHSLWVCVIGCVSYSSVFIILFSIDR